MVGVPGKFAGCNTCRQRRIKCDNERPKCKKCINAGRECEGYERDRVFIVGTPEGQGRCSSHPHRSISLHAAKERRPSHAVKRGKAIGPRALMGSPSADVPYAPSNQIQFLALHASVLSPEPLHQANEGFVTLPSLLDCLPDLARRSPALESALRALCLIHLGVTKKDEGLVKESILHNTQAMSKVRLATINERTTTNIETLAASICLYLYEQVSCTVEKAGAWRILFKGSSLLVRARGPASYKCYPDHHFFAKLFRNEAIFDAMARRKPTFLAENDWRTVPWENIPKTDIDRLMDIQVFLPRIFELEEQLESRPPSPARADKAKALLQKCIQIDRVFENWYSKLQSESDKPLLWSLPWNSNRQKTAQKLGFDMCCAYTTYFEFLDLRAALLHLYYWAGLTLFYRTMQNIHRLCYEDSHFRPSHSPEWLMPARSSSAPASASAPASISLRLSPSPAPLSHTFTSPIPNQSLPAHDTAHPSTTTPSPPSSYAHTSPAHSLASDSHHHHHHHCSPIPALDAKYAEDAVAALAHRICRGLPYALDRTLHARGPDRATWPIWCALQVFRRQGLRDQTCWCLEMTQMWGREGWRFASQMGRVDWLDYRDVGI